MPEPRVVRHDSAAALAAAVGAAFLDRVRARTEDGTTVHVALTGGTSGIAVLRAAGASDARADVDWSRVHFWWGDDRFVPAGAPDRNSDQARAAFLERIDVPADNIHEMAAADEGLTLDEGAAAYAAELARFGDAGQAWPSFEICFLGVGPDAHIASLFPGRDEIAITDTSAVAVRDSPKPPPERISLTLPVLNAAASVWLILAGADKAEALGRAVRGDAVPAAAAKGRIETVFHVDTAAAAGLD